MMDRSVGSNLVDLTLVTPDRANPITVQDSPVQDSVLAEGNDIQVMSPTQNNQRLTSQGKPVPPHHGTLVPEDF